MGRGRVRLKFFVFVALTLSAVRGTRAMLALPIHGGWGRLLVALALTLLALPGSVASARMARAQVSPPPGEEPKNPRQLELDDAEVERLFREYQHLTRAAERRQVQSAPATPPTDWNSRPRGDFWTPRDRERLFGR
jgi:hypothetical protein